jgi:hypothetical protein
MTWEKHTVWTLSLVFTTFLLTSPAVRAQVSANFDKAEGQAILAELNPDKRAEVEARLTGGNTVHGILETMLLNNLKARHPGSHIVALDFGRGTAVLESPNKQIHIVSFDTKTLAIKG